MIKDMVASGNPLGEVESLVCIHPGRWCTLLERSSGRSRHGRILAPSGDCPTLTTFLLT